MARGRTQDVHQSTVLLNGKQAEDEMRRLTKTADDFRKKKSEAFEKNDLTAYKKWDKELKGVEKSMRQLKNETTSVDSVLNNLNGASLNDVNKALRQLRKEMAGMKSTDPGFKRLAQQASILDKRQGELIRSSRQLRKESGGLKDAMASMLPVVSIAAAVAGIKQLFTNVIRVRQEFEKYEAVLTNSLGSQSAATRELNMLKQFAAETPFALSELTAAYVKLTNYGLKPTREELTKYGDVAASVGKSFDQYVEAIADAVTFEFERLKEFGIKAKKEGDKISFTFKEQTTVVDANSQAIKAYMAGLGELEGVQGSMAAISATLGGRISNLGDAWDNLLNSLGGQTSGVFITVINWLTKFTNMVTMALRSVEDIREEVFRNMADSSLKSAVGEIEVITARLLKGGMTAQDAQQRAVELYAEQMQSSVDALQMQLQTAEGAQKEALQERINLMTQELDAVKTHYTQLDAQAKIREQKEKERNDKLLQEEKKKKNEIYSTLQGSSASGQYYPSEEERRIAAWGADFRPADEENIDDGFSDPLAGMDRLFEEQKLKLDKQRAAGLLSEQEHNILLEDLENAHLLTMLNLREQLGMDTLEIEKELAQKQIEEQKRVEQEKIASQQRIFDNVARFQHLAGNLVNSLMENELANAGENEEKKKQIRKKYAVAQFAISAGQIVTDTAVSIMKAFADLGPVGGLIASALLGATGAAQLAIAYGEMNKVRNLWTGGFTGPGEWDKPQGIVHSNEFVANRFATQNPTVRPVLDMIDYAQRSGNISNLNLPAAMAAAPGTKEIIRESSTTVDPTSIQIMAELRDEIKKGIRSYVVANQDYARAHTEYMDKYNKRINQRS